MNAPEPNPKCIVDGCDRDAILITPLPVCGHDALRVIAEVRAAQAGGAVNGDGPMTRVMALAELDARPLFTDIELAARTGWPVEWVKRHRWPV